MTDPQASIISNNGIDSSLCFGGDMTPPPSYGHRMLYDARGMGVEELNREERARREMAAMDTTYQLHSRVTTFPQGTSHHMALPTLGSEDDEANEERNEKEDHDQLQVPLPSIGLDMLSLSSPKTPAQASASTLQQNGQQDTFTCLRWKRGPPGLVRKPRRKSDAFRCIGPSFDLHESSGYQTPRYQYLKISRESPLDSKENNQDDSNTNMRTMVVKRSAEDAKLELPRVALKRKYSSLRLDGKEFLKRSTAQDDEEDKEGDDEEVARLQASSSLLANLPFFPSELPDEDHPLTSPQVFEGTNLKPLFDASAVAATDDVAVNNNGNVRSDISNKNDKDKVWPLAGVRLIAPRPSKRVDSLLAFQTKTLNTATFSADMQC